MERIINEVTEKLKSEFNIFFSGKQTDIEAAESFFGSRIAEAVLQLLQAYYEQQDQQLLEDKAGRKQAGLSVERHGDKREVLTLFGRLGYRRTYYKKASGGYEYPVDELAGVEAYERISEGRRRSIRANQRGCGAVAGKRKLPDVVRESKPVCDRRACIQADGNEQDPIGESAAGGV